MARKIFARCSDLRFAMLALVVAFAAQRTSVAEEAAWSAEQFSRPFPEAASEQQLLEQLRSDSLEGKAIACKQLSIYGSAAAVPELAKLLSDERLASWSRIALEAIPGAEADAALIQASNSLDGKLLIGVINSLGVRQAAQAVEPLANRLKDKDAEVAAASAVALGKIGNDAATKKLRAALATAAPKVRSAVAEGCVLCAERMMDAGDHAGALALYEAIRKADVPKQRVVEATRGVILASGEQGIPLLIEQLRSKDKTMFYVGLGAARELGGEKVVEALSQELATAEPERASLIVYAIGDRPNVVLPSSILRAVSEGDQQVRLAAIALVGRLGNESAVPTLLEVATEDDQALSQSAKDALAGLAGRKVDAEIASRLPNARGKARLALIELVGKRQISATPELVKSLKSEDAALRRAALQALGSSIEPKDLNVLVATMSDAKEADDTDVAEKALHEAAIRMPNREATAEELAAAMTKSSPATKARLLRILGAMGGPTALETIAEAVKSGDDQLQDVGTQVLGQWMTADAGPVLLEITKDAENRKYQVRALRGYLRIARQLKDLPDGQRIEMARQALEVAQRAEERELALDVLKRCPSQESIELATSLVDDKELRDRAVETAIFIGEQIKDQNPEAAKEAGKKALEASPPKELADRARALTSP